MCKIEREKQREGMYVILFLYYYYFVSQSAVIYFECCWQSVEVTAQTLLVFK